MPIKRKLYLVMAACLLLVVTGNVSASESAYWEQLRSGKAVALMRHALAPGNGDPNNFQVNDCSTQRNLSDEGRAQAMRIGEVFKANGIDEANVFSSQWCRCVDTGVELNFDAPTPLPIINSFYADRSTATTQTIELENWLKSRLENAESHPILPAVLVSHQVNITALTNVYPSSGEVVFIALKEGDLIVLGTHLTD